VNFEDTGSLQIAVPRQYAKVAAVIAETLKAEIKTLEDTDVNVSRNMK